MQMHHTGVPVSLGSRLDRVKSVEVAVATRPHPVPARTSRWPTIALGAALAVGVALRLAAFAADRPLWLDEAMIAMNLTDRGVGRLFEPLDRNQTAPVAFLLAGKLCAAAFGPTEHALRLPALVASVLGMVAFAVAAVRLLPPWTARLAVLLFALSPTVVNYAAEVKQYSSDAAVSAGLLALAAPLLRTPTRGRLTALAAGGAAAVWASHPAVFVLASIGVVLFVRSLRDREYRRTVFIIGLGWLVSFAAVYWVNVRHGANNDYLAEYWAPHFVPLSPAVIPWLSGEWVDFFRAVGGYGGALFPVAGLAAVLAVIGFVSLWKDGRRPTAAVLVGGFAVALLASALHKYPFVGRLLLFLVPAGVLLVARGAAVLAKAVWSRSRVAAVVLVAAVVYAPAVEVARQFRHPLREEDVPAALHFIRERWQPGDRVYVYNGDSDVGAGPAFEFYSRGDRFPTEAVVLGGVHRDDPRGYQPEVNALAATPGRVWVLFAHQHAQEEAWIRAYFDSVGDRGEQFVAPGDGGRASAFEYTIRRR